MNRLALATAAFMLVATAAASATVLNYSFTGDATMNFTLDTNHPFVADPASILFNDIPTSQGVADLVFVHAVFGGGVEITAAGTSTVFLNTVGAQLFSGEPNAPTMLTGSFALNEYKGSGKYLLEVTSGAVPEASTWAMMLAGFAGVGLAIRRQRRVTVAFAA